MSRHEYEIIINDICESNTGVYSYGSIRKISLSVEDQRAVIRYELGKLRTAEDLIAFRYNDFRDALRKVILLHAVTYDRDLVIKKIIIKIDDESYFFDRDNDPTGHFPYDGQHKTGACRILEIVKRYYYRDYQNPDS